VGREEISFFVKASSRQSFYQMRYDARGNVSSLRLSSCIAFLSRVSNKAAHLRPALFWQITPIQRHTERLNDIPKPTPLHFLESNICVIFINQILWQNTDSIVLTLSWPEGHIYPTYKDSFQVRWDNSIPLFLHAAIYLEVSLFRWTSQNAFSRETAVYKWYCVQCCIAALHTVSFVCGCFTGKCILTRSTE